MLRQDEVWQLVRFTVAWWDTSRKYPNPDSDPQLLHPWLLYFLTCVRTSSHTNFLSNLKIYYFASSSSIFVILLYSKATKNSIFLLCSTIRLTQCFIQDGNTTANNVLYIIVVKTRNPHAKKKFCKHVSSHIYIYIYIYIYSTYVTIILKALAAHVVQIGDQKKWFSIRIDHVPLYWFTAPVRSITCNKKEKNHRLQNPQDTHKHTDH